MRKGERKMEKSDVRCPVCGKINRSLYLGETDGWMECDGCGCAAHLVSAKTNDLTDPQNCEWQVVRPLPFGRRAG